jgi:predicted acyl esterase
VHESQEWHDLYQKETNDELQAFFDRYLKGVDNGWETKTPQVRVSLLGYNVANIKNRIFPAWPIPKTTYQTLYIGPEQRLLLEPSTSEGIMSYQSDVDSQQVDNDSEELVFRVKLPERTFLIGSVKAVLYMSCDDLDDMDIFLQVRKADAAGNILRSYNVPEQDMARQGLLKEKVPLINPVVYLGPHGQIRASHRAIDTEISKPHYISHSHLVEEPVPPGQVVRVETSIWPGGIIFEKDEYLVIKISGHPMYLAEFPTLRGAFKARNKGLHKVRYGGKDGSHFVVPFVQP